VTGDHKQLRPKLNAHLLARNRLDISLFERLVESGRFATATLQLQQRMQPQIADLTRFVYEPNVRDHPKVKRFMPVEGVTQSVFFVSHSIEEDAVAADQLQRSKSHQSEAVFLLHLAAYLLKQGRYQPEDFAFLSAYVHQVRVMRRLRDSDFPELEGAQFKTIDNFQASHTDR